MKFFTKLFCVLALTFTLQACGGSSSDETKTPNTEDAAGGQANPSDTTSTGESDNKENVTPQ
ncbi:MAG TPA: hypothetical protein DCS93_32255 [Microscillaceae bacterium]|nr:hypothetical protein [Microscillaceae bacterium]